MISIYNEFREQFKKEEYNDDINFDNVFSLVWDSIVRLLTINGTLIKCKGNVNIPKDMLHKALELGLMIYYDKHNSRKYKQDFKDIINLISFYILDDYNNKEVM